MVSESLQSPSLFFTRVRMPGDAQANPQNSVTCGAARFTVLTSRLIRLEWSSSAHFEDRGTFAFPNRADEPVTFALEQSDQRVQIKTDALTLRYTADGTPFSSANLSIRLTVNGEVREWRPGMIGSGNLRGTTRTLDQRADAVSLSEGIISREGWALYDDSGTPVWEHDGGWVEARIADHQQDWYFFGYGHDYKAALAEYMRFGLPIPLIPRFVLGGWWSRFWAYTDQDLMHLVDDFREHDLPLDVLVVDMDWHTPFAWTGYTWNRDLFPDPDAFLAWVHAHGLYVTFNLHPAQGVQKHEIVYPEFAQRLGQDPALGEAVAFRATDKAFMQNYFELLHHPMEQQGVDFWWLDWQQGEASDIKGLDPLPWLNHLHFRDSTRRGTRPMLYSRWGGLGNHRYPIGFSGDAYPTWEALRFQTYLTPTAANVAYGWWSHDIGGHFGATDPELYARWVQFGAVSPCLRLHSTKDPLAERRPWAFPEPIFAAAKAAFQFRYQLLPYLYSAARTASQQGLSLCLPIYYDYPDTPDAYTAREQYFLGDQMIVAPVVHPIDPATGLAPVDVWFPPGTWIDYTTLEAYTGPRWLRLQADLNRIPIFVKAGAIIPLAPPIQQTREFDGSNLILNVFPGADGRFELYEDDGVSEAYQSGEYELTTICTKWTDSATLELEIGGSNGNCPSLPTLRTTVLHVRAICSPDQLKIDDKISENWVYDHASRSLTLTLPSHDRFVSQKVVISGIAANFTESEIVPQPFFKVIDYTTYEEARHQLGTVILSGESIPFDAQIDWELHKEGVTYLQTTALKNCTERQIVNSPYTDDGTLRALRWRVTVTLNEDQRFEYTSQTAYPSVNHWQALIYDPQKQPLKIAGVNDNLPWTIMTQTAKDTANLRQPFALILLEQERERIQNSEPLEACLKTTLVSPTTRTAVLHTQEVGEATCFLNGVELVKTEPVARAEMPTFVSWMPPQHGYYELPLQAGANTLVIFTQPDREIGWWGVSAMVLDPSGEALMLNGE